MFSCVKEDKYIMRKLSNTDLRFEKENICCMFFIVAFNKREKNL